MNILIGIFMKFIELFLKGDIDVKVKKTGEIHHGNPNTRHALTDMLELHYSDKGRIRPTEHSGDIGRDDNGR